METVSKFKVGDKVRCIKKYQSDWMVGKIGIVYDATPSNYTPSVYFEDHNGKGHMGHSSPFDDTCGHWNFWGEDDCLELVEPAKAQLSGKRVDFIIADDINVKAQDHYADSGVQPIELIMADDHDGKFCKGNIIKYGHRAGKKIYDGLTADQSEIMDLEKVITYAEFRLRQLKGEPILSTENKK